MMKKKTFELREDRYKKNCINFIEQLQINTDKPLMIVIQEVNRTLEQNAKLWAMLGDVSKQVIWYGNKLTSEEWKHVFTASLKRQKTVPGIDGGFVVLGQSTSRMRVSELRDLIELIYAFGAEQGVNWSEEAKQAAEWAKRWGDGKR